MSKLDYQRGEILAGKYEVVDPLDITPLGPNYRVKHQRSGAFLGLTLIRPKLAGRFNKEHLLDIYMKLRDLQHPSLIQVLELGEHEGLAYFTWEDFEGQTLRDLMNEYRIQGKRFELLEAAQILNQLLDGLRKLHELGFIVRGLRPEYIMINARRIGPRAKNLVVNVKIMGSGFWDLVPGSELAEDEFSRGEVQYLAPEMKAVEPVATVRADIYSAGVIFYELLTGIAPFGTFPMPATIRPDLPKVVNDIAELALAPSSEDRYQTASDFIADLHRSIMQGNTYEDAPKRSMRMILAIAGGVLVATVALSYVFRPLSDDQLEEKFKYQGSVLRADVQKKAASLPPREVVEQALMGTENMVYIPGGPFIAGRMFYDPESFSSEPLAQVAEVKPFLIDRFEYPNQLGAPPIKEVNFETAQTLCEQQEKRLCRADEWEKACKGPLNSLYAYALPSLNTPADEYDPLLCGLEIGRTAGSYDKCRSGYQVYDLSGGYREWTASVPGGRHLRRMVKGGSSLINAARETRCAFSTDESITFRDQSLSFRCCKDIP